MIESGAEHWRILTLGVLVSLLAVVAALAIWGGGRDSAVDRLKTQLGAQSVPSFVVVAGLLLWLALFVSLFSGLLWTIWHFVFTGFGDMTDQALRFDLVRLAALTATLGAVVALPFTMIRLALTREQNRHASDVLFNDKITEATRDLYAQRQVTKAVIRGGSYQKHQDFWEDDIIRRNAAIDQLERLVEERPETATSVARMLSVYVRELSKAHPAVAPPPDAGIEDIREWARTLELQRSDMEKAVQTLGRLRRWAAKAGEDLIIDLREANLQTMALATLDFENALFAEAKLQGASLSLAALQDANLLLAKLQTAELYRAKLTGAYLVGADLRMTNLIEANLQGAILYRAELQGANFIRAHMDAATSLKDAAFRGAAFRGVDYTHVRLTQAQVDQVFGDATVKLPKAIEPPERFSREYETEDAFKAAWRAWQKEIGFDPENPE